MSIQLLSPLPFLLVLFLHSPTLLAQSPASAPAKPLAHPPAKPRAPPPATPLLATPAAAPTAEGPANIVSILKKAGHFNALIKLLKKTKMDERIFSLLNDSNPLTIFAPTDAAFSLLPPNTLKTFTFEQRIQFVQFHVVNSFISFSDFDTVSSELSTQAGDNSGHKFPLNITVIGNQMNITTGLVNATVTKTLYTDDQLAVYEVDRVLLPWRLCGSASSPCSTAKPAEEAPSPVEPVSTEAETSGAVPMARRGLMFFVGFVVAGFNLCF